MNLKRIATCSSALLLVGLLAASFASAQGLPIKGGVVHACVKTKGAKKQRGTIRVVGAAKQCKRKKGELPLTWSLQGPAGTAGTQGAQGAPGSSGASGAQGPRGETGSAAAVEGQLKEVITNQSKEIAHLSSSLLSLNAELGSLESTVGSVQTTATSALGKLTTLEGGVGGLEKTVGTTVKSLTSLEGNVGTVEGTVKTAQEAATSATKQAGEATTSVGGLLTKVNNQCGNLKEIGGQANLLTAGVSELTAALNLVLGGFLPKLPENSKTPVC